VANILQQAARTGRSAADGARFRLTPSALPRLFPYGPDGYGHGPQSRHHTIRRTRWPVISKTEFAALLARIRPETKSNEPGLSRWDASWSWMVGAFVESPYF
jgi:hypothetical protein